MIKLLLLMAVITLSSFGINKDVELEKEGYRKYTATAYCLRGKMANGKRVHKGAIAVDPRVIPLGTKVHITGIKKTGTYVAGDTGGNIKGRRIDVWKASCKEAIKFGRKSVSLKIL